MMATSFPSSSSLSVKKGVVMSCLNRLQVALHLFSQTHQQDDNNEQSIVKVSDNQVILSDIPNAPIFPFTHVLDMNTHDHFLFDSIPHSVFDELMQGNDASIAIYDASSHNRFDTKIMLAFEDLFSLSASEVSIQFVEYDHDGSSHDLIARDKDEGREYKVDNIEIIEKYYKFGVDYRTHGTVSIFSITIRQKKHSTSRLNIIDLSGCPDSILDQFAELCISRYNRNTTTMKSNIGSSISMFQSIEKSTSLLIIASASHLDPINQLESTLSYTSNIYEKTSYKDDNIKRSQSLKHKSIQNDDTEYLRRIILKLTNEVNALRTYRTTRGSLNTITSSENNEPRHASMFSSISNSTQMTMPDHINTITEEKVLVSDLNRQIEELENQIEVTRERNTHVERELQRSTESQDQLFLIQEKQDCIIHRLECKLNEMEHLNDELYQKLLLETQINSNVKRQIEEDFQDIQRGMQHLGSQRTQLDQVVHVMESMVSKSDKDSSDALQELAALRLLSQQHEDELKLKDEEIESLSYQLYHNNINTQRKIIKSIELANNSSANSSDISFHHQRTLALESRIEELDECIEHIRNQRDNYSDQLEERTDEVEKLKQSLIMQASKITALEKKVCDLEGELYSNRQMIRENDFSGLVHKLEDEVTRLKQEKSADERDFEANYESALNEIERISKRMSQKTNDINRLEATVDKLNEQLDDTTSNYIQKEEELLELQDQLETVQQRLSLKHDQQLQRQKELERKDSIISNYKSNLSTALVKKQLQRSDSKQSFVVADKQNELATWLYDKLNDNDSGKAEVVRKFVQITNENARLELWISDLESQLIEQRYQIALTSYESVTPPSTYKNNRRKTKTGSVGSYSLSHKNSTKTKGSDRDSIQSDASGLRWTTSRQSGSLKRSTTPNVPPPPTDPPHHPLPPIPMLPYIPNNNSTCPLPSAQQQYMKSNNSISNNSRLSNTSAPSSIAPIDHYDHMHRSRLRSHIPENDFKKAIEVIYKLESQISKFQAKLQEQHHEIETLLDEQASLQSVKNQMNMTLLELKNERALKLKAEKAQAILERRMEDMMNTKKNKFRCF